MNKDKPPRIAEWIIYVISKPGNKAGVLGDIDEEYNEVILENGKFRANLWLVKQIVIPLIFFLGSNIIWSFAMFKNYLKTVLRIMKRDKANTFINVAGLTLGFTCFILIMLYVKFETSYDKYHNNAKNIYTFREAYQSAPFAPALKAEFPEIRSVARIHSYGVMKTNKYLFSINGTGFMENELYLVDPEIFEIFTFKFLTGNSETALDDPNSIVLTKSIAEKFFGNENPIGKVITFENKYELKVTALINDVPSNSYRKFKMLIPFVNYSKIKGLSLNTWGYKDVNAYCLIDDDTDIASIEERSNAFLLKTKYRNEQGDKHNDEKLTFYPLVNEYLHPRGGGGPFKYLAILSAIAFTILILGCINYMNLTNARSLQRAKEIGIRKVSGAGRRQLVRQILTESAAISILSFFISMLLSILLLPSFRNLMERRLILDFSHNIFFFAGLFAVAVLVSVVSAIYPAFFMSSFMPAVVLKGLFKSSKKGIAMKNIMLVFQFTVSIILIISTLVIRNQINYIRSKDAGFSKEQIVSVIVRDSGVKKRFPVFVNEVRKYPDIINASASDQLPNSIYYPGMMTWPGKTKEDGRIISHFGMVDHNYVDVFGIDLIKGRNFAVEETSDQSGAFLVNEAAIKQLGWEDPIGKEINVWNQRGKIVGVMKDFHNNSYFSKIRPLTLYLNPTFEIDQWLFKSKTIYYLSVKVRRNSIPEILKFLETTFKKFSPNYPFEYRFFNEIFDQRYKSVQKTGEIIGVFSFISIFIGCLGLYGLVTFITEQRTKEIGIRKTLGATVSGIVVLISKGLLKWVVIAAFISFPAAWYAMSIWLEDFAYRISLVPGLFVLGAFIVASIAFLSVVVKTYRSASADPVESLRIE